MGIFDALKGLFGVSKHNDTSNSNDQVYTPPVNYFIKPDWANEDEDSDDDLVMRSPSSNFTFSVFANPLEIHRYFEQQMNEMAKQIEFFSKDSGFSNNEHFDSFFGQSHFFNADQIPAPLPPNTDIDRSNNLRDKCLKPDARKKHLALDSDLDNEFKNGELTLFKSPEVPQIHSPSKPRVFSSQVFTRIVRRPDGSMEEVRTKQVGDQKYTKIIQTDSQGHTNIHEDIVNIDEDKLKDFQLIGGNAQPKLHFKDWFKLRL